MDSLDERTNSRGAAGDGEVWCRRRGWHEIVGVDGLDRAGLNVQAGLSFVGLHAAPWRNLSSFVLFRSPFPSPGCWNKSKRTAISFISSLE